jgi:hypothetical protein
MLRGAITKVTVPPHVFAFSEADYLDFEVDMIYKTALENFDFGQFWSGENVGTGANESDITNRTALEIEVESHQSQSAKSHEVEICWSVELPWKDPTPSSRTMTDNLGRSKAMWRKP